MCDKSVEQARLVVGSACTATKQRIGCILQRAWHVLLSTGHLSQDAVQGLRVHAYPGRSLLVAGVGEGARQPKGLETAVDMIFGSAAATIAAFGLKVPHTCPLLSDPCQCYVGNQLAMHCLML